MSRPKSKITDCPKPHYTRGVCKACYNACYHRWWRNNTEAGRLYQVRDNARKRKRIHKSILRKLQGDGVREAQLEAQSGQCWVSGKTLDLSIPKGQVGHVEWSHVVSVSRWLDGEYRDVFPDKASMAVAGRAAFLVHAEHNTAKRHEPHPHYYRLLAEMGLCELSI